jgi:hypothetical protein
VLAVFILLGFFGGGWTAYREIQKRNKIDTRKRNKKRD